MRSYYSPDYQETGWVTDLDTANAMVAAARNLTPQSEWYAYRSYIRREDGGYAWGWVLR